MYKLFQVRANFIKINEEAETPSKTTETYLLNAISYQDAEIQITDHIKDYIAGECEFNITKLNIDDFCPLEKEVEESYWYDVRVTHIEKVEKDDELIDKYVNKKYYIEAEDLKIALDRLDILLEDSDSNWFAFKIEETKVDAILVDK